MLISWITCCFYFLCKFFFINQKSMKCSLPICPIGSVGFGCESGFRKQRRSIDLQKELAQKGAVLFESPVPFQTYFNFYSF